eukprot:SAG31_NODE_1367_length_8615_cov_12.875763_7_plen_68_part_00
MHLGSLETPSRFYTEIVSRSHICFASDTNVPIINHTVAKPCLVDFHTLACRWLAAGRAQFLAQVHKF